MFKIMCGGCGHELGFQVEVGNVFMGWAKDRMLVDCGQVECLH